MLSPYQKYLPLHSWAILKGRLWGRSKRQKRMKMKIQDCDSVQLWCDGIWLQHDSIQLWCIVCSRGWKGYFWWAGKLVQRLYNVISIRNNITPIKVTYMYRKGISVNLHPFSASDMGIADSRRRNHPNLMRLRVRHVFLTVKTVLVRRNDRMAQPAQNSPAFI